MITFMVVVVAAARSCCCSKLLPLPRWMLPIPEMDHPFLLGLGWSTSYVEEKKRVIEGEVVYLEQFKSLYLSN